MRSQKGARDGYRVERKHVGIDGIQCKVKVML